MASAGVDPKSGELQPSADAPAEHQRALEAVEAAQSEILARGPEKQGEPRWRKRHGYQVLELPGVTFVPRWHEEDVAFGSHSFASRLAGIGIFGGLGALSGAYSLRDERPGIWGALLALGVLLLAVGLLSARAVHVADVTRDRRIVAKMGTYLLPDGVLVRAGGEFADHHRFVPRAEVMGVERRMFGRRKYSALLHRSSDGESGIVWLSPDDIGPIVRDWMAR
ncbi:MAG: hypothetical protein U0263_12090 [Polyangiaceae bacterium]